MLTEDKLSPLRSGQNALKFNLCNFQHITFICGQVTSEKMKQNHRLCLAHLLSALPLTPMESERCGATARQFHTTGRCEVELTTETRD